MALNLCVIIRVYNVKRKLLIDLTCSEVKQHQLCRCCPKLSRIARDPNTAYIDFTSLAISIFIFFS